MSSLKKVSSQKTCIFCDRLANSKEHFWPCWLHTHLRPRSRKHNRIKTAFHPSYGEKNEGVIGRDGAAHTAKIRVVCTTCNNGWMSRIEDEVERIVLPLVQAEATTLSHMDCEILAKWIAIKCLVLENFDPQNAVIPVKPRHLLKSEGTIPESYHIFVGYHDGGASTFFQLYSMKFCHSSEPITADNPGRDLETIAFTIGALFVFVVAQTFDREAVPDDFVLRAGMRKLYPSPAGDMHLNLYAPLHDSTVLSLTNILKSFRSHPDVQWN